MSLSFFSKMKTFFRGRIWLSTKPPWFPLSLIFKSGQVTTMSVTTMMAWLAWLAPSLPISTCSWSHLIVGTAWERGQDWWPSTDEGRGVQSRAQDHTHPDVCLPGSSVIPSLSFSCLCLLKQVYIFMKEQGPAWVHRPSGNFLRWPSLHGHTLFCMSQHPSIPEKAIVVRPLFSIIR